MPPLNERSPADSTGPDFAGPEFAGPEFAGPDFAGPGPFFEAGMPPFEMDSDTVLQILRMLDGRDQGSCERTGFSSSALGATRGRANWLDVGYEA